MSVLYYQQQVNALDKEISDLEKKKGEKDKEAAKIQAKIIDIEKSITKNTPLSLYKSKQKQIEHHRAEVVKKTSNSADIAKKIADKQKKRNDAYLKLQKAQQDEQKKKDRANKKTAAEYEKRIAELQHQIYTSSIQQAKNDSPSETSGESEEYDVFVSHAFEDKEDFVNEFVDELKAQDLRVWYDTDRMPWGASMRESIDNGLSKSKYGVVVLSPYYIDENKYWTKTELNGLFQKETVNGKIILPIWHNLTKKQVIEYSPIIADRKAMNTASMTPSEIAAEMKKLFCD